MSDSYVRIYLNLNIKKVTTGNGYFLVGRLIDYQSHNRSVYSNVMNIISHLIRYIQVIKTDKFRSLLTDN